MGLPLLENIQCATGFSTWQILFLGVLIVFAANYLTMIYFDKMDAPAPLTAPKEREGFENPAAATAASEADAAKYEWLNNIQLYDPFFAGIYDLLIQPSKRAQAEVTFLLERWCKGKTKVTDLKILDAGCGTGVTALAFAKAGAQRVVGIDRSEAMLEYARTTNLPASVLSEEQKGRVEFRQKDLVDPNAAGAAEFDAATMLYFSIYYMKDLDSLFRNFALWVRPGGMLAIHCVNKHKFDPLLDSASPFVFSVQKYSKQRVTKSKVKFDKFDYEAVFDLDEEDPNYAEFRETFRFKDGSVRRQRHIFTMHNIPLIVQKARAAGWTYQGFIDQVKQGFEYSYLLLFTH